MAVCHRKTGSATTSTSSSIRSARCGPICRRDFYAELPRLADGPLSGYPRVYALATEMVAHSDNRVDVDVLRTFVLAYQESQPLRIGEIWAIPIMLRMALVERLCVLAEEVLPRTHGSRARAGDRRAAGAAGGCQARTPVAMALGGRAARARSRRRLSWSCCGGCAIARRRWRRPGRNCSSRCTAQGGADAMIRQEAQLEASMQVSIGNAITSMRTLSALDWPTFVEQVSHVERVLRDDPAGAYARMDFATRDRYRQSVEQTRPRLTLLGDRGRAARLRPRGSRTAGRAGRRAPAPRRVLPGVTRPIRARIRPPVSPTRPRAVRAVRLSASGPWVSQRDRAADRPWHREPARQRGAPRRLASRCCCWWRWPSWCR